MYRRASPAATTLRGVNPERTEPRPGPLYRLYQRRLRRELDPANVPHHIAVIVDGNRRWAKQRLQERVAVGHRAGARKIPEFLHWCEDAGVEVVTLYLLSSDNLSGRDTQELEDLFGIIAELARSLSEIDGWRVKHVGSCEGLPEGLSSALAEAERVTADRTGLHVNLAVGYGGRSEITAAMRSVIAEHQAAGGTIDTLAERLTPEMIGEHLWTRGQADPDLVIRTSGEQRLSDFMLWRSAYSEFLFLDKYWPEMTKQDVTDILKEYTGRKRRFGG